jgi:hypothetical protein
MSFNGVLCEADSLQRVEFNSINLGTAFIVRCIVKGNGTIYGCDDSSLRGYFRVNSEGVLSVRNVNTTTTYTFDTGVSFLATDPFRSIEVYRSGGNTTIYVDGEYKGYQNNFSNFNFANVSTKMNIACLYRTGSATDFYSTIEIAMLEFSAGTTPVMKLDAQVEGGTGSILKDTVGSNDGTLINSPTWTTYGSELIAFGFTLLGSIEVPSLGGATASNVPLVIKPFVEFTPAMLAGLASNGADFRLSDDIEGNNELPKELVKFDKSTGDIIWSDFPSVAAGIKYQVWGSNPTATQPAADSTFGSEAVWVDYELVTHDGVTDSAGNYPTISRLGSVSLAESVFGVIDGASNGGYCSVPINKNRNQDRSITAWTNANSGNRTVAGLFHSGSENDWTALSQRANGDGGSTLLNSVNAWMRKSSTVWSLNASLAAITWDKWQRVGGNYTNSLREAFEGESNRSSDSTTASLSGSYDTFGLGRLLDSTSGDGMNGDWCEVWWKESTVSPSEQAVTFLNQSATGAWWIAEDAGGGGDVVDVNTLSSIQSISEIALTQSSVISLNSLLTAQIIDQVILNQFSTVTISPLFNAQALDQLSINQGSATSIENLSEQQSVDPVSLIQKHVTSLSDINELQSVEGLSLSQQMILELISLVSNQDLEAVGISQNSIIDIDSLTSGQVLQLITLSQEGSISIEGVSNSQTLEAILISQAGVLNLNGLEMASFIESSGIKEHNIASLEDITSAQALEQVTATPLNESLIGLFNASSSQDLQEIILNQSHVLEVDSLSGVQVLQAVSMGGIVVGNYDGVPSLFSAYNGSIKIINSITGKVKIL